MSQSFIHVYTDEWFLSNDGSISNKRKRSQFQYVGTNDYTNIVKNHVDMRDRIKSPVLILFPSLSLLWMVA